MSDLNDIQLPADFDDLSKHAPLLHALRGKGDGFAVPENYFGENSELVNAKTILPSDDGFVVPAQYFETLAERIIAVVRLDAQLPRSDESGFTVPENYFENFAEEISSIAPLSGLKKTDAFEVPEHYFEELDTVLHTRIALDNLKQDEGFVVPDDYFSKLTSTVMARAAADDLQKGSDADVPEGYFDTLADRITARIAAEEGTAEEKQERGRIIVFAEVLRRYARPVALAASAALLIAVSAWFLSRDKAGNQHELAKNDEPKKVVPQPVQQQTGPKNNIAVQQLNNDSISNQDVQPVENAPKHKAVASNHKKKKQQEELNQEPVTTVKVEKQDVLDQIDLLDETMMTEALTNTDVTITANDDADAIRDELMNDLPGYLLDGGGQKE